MKAATHISALACCEQIEAPLVQKFVVGRLTGKIYIAVDWQSGNDESATPQVLEKNAWTTPFKTFGGASRCLDQTKAELGPLADVEIIVPQRSLWL